MEVIEARFRTHMYWHTAGEGRYDRDELIVLSSEEIVNGVNDTIRP